ncbi:23925_t:CDS:2 [Entrophospora sp. SA101]|nr:15607_t:CDS:2 [Entrophospora sp. SA101]CAJ0759883.1 23925_t:CDS:2 [Entrophospora sp. SA101]CAJ0914550.1 7622_t:CDS:2 [Entrophospora sp. SA101]CAJ0914976.1 21564_t:CDS:2 [Entrophospora sp. SA101]
MATKLQHQLLSARNSLKQKEKELNLEQLKNNEQFWIKNYRPANLNYIKVADICKNLEIMKGDYKIYLIEIKDIMKYYNTPINVPFKNQNPFNGRKPGAKVDAIIGY